MALPFYLAHVESGGGGGGCAVPVANEKIACVCVCRSAHMCEHLCMHIRACVCMPTHEHVYEYACLQM